MTGKKGLDQGDSFHLARLCLAPLTWSAPMQSWIPSVAQALYGISLFTGVPKIRKIMSF
jgi:hypothetical protein